MVEAPFQLDSYPPLISGEEGERFLRPSERKHEAKDLNKFLQKGAASMGRIAQPHGMALGGGMGDYAMRGEEFFFKKLEWKVGGGTSATTSLSTSPSSASVVRFKTYPIGALADVSASWNVEAPQPVAQGIPVMVSAIQRAKGAFLFEQECEFKYNNPSPGASEAITTTTAFSSYYVSSGVNRNIPLSIPNTTGTSAAVATAAVLGNTGSAKLNVKWKFSPPDLKDINTTVDGVAVTLDSIKYYCVQTLTYGSGAIDTGATAGFTPLFIVRHSGTSYIPIASNITTIWLDLSIQNNLASDPVTNYYEVLYSRGSTISGHDGYPYNYSIGNN